MNQNNRIRVTEFIMNNFMTDEIEDIIDYLSKERVLAKEIELQKYKKFVEHIYNHSEKPNCYCEDDWVKCKICGKTLREILKEDDEL